MKIEHLAYVCFVLASHLATASLIGQTQRFLELSKAKTDAEKDEFAEVNRCRSITKDFWREVRTHREAYGEFTPSAQEEYQARHTRFVAIVKPLDILPGYENEPSYVYDPLPTVRAAEMPAKK